MSSLNSLLTGSVQTPNSNNNLDLNYVQKSTPVISDFNIFPVGNSLDPSMYVYDGQTNLLINSSFNKNNNIVQLQYIEQIINSNWRYDITSSSYLNGSIVNSETFSQETQNYGNTSSLTISNNYTGLYNIDITNSNVSTDSSGNSGDTLFFSLTSAPYISYKGCPYIAPGIKGEPTINNITANYSNYGSDSFFFSSQYYKMTTNEIIIIQMIFTISNTPSLSRNDTNLSLAPELSVVIYNKVFNKDNLSSFGTGNSCPKPKVYSTGSIPLQYQIGTAFETLKPCFYLYNNLPVIIADGFTKVFGTFSVFYIPPSINNNVYYLKSGNQSLDCSIPNAYSGYYIENNLPVGNVTPGEGLGNVSGTTDYGYFVIGLVYSYNSTKYNPGTVFTSEVLISNTWRSPISIFNAYEAFSVNDMITKQVVLLFGKNLNGGTFLVTNSGTPFSQINNFGITSLGNFMAIMRTLILHYTRNYSLVDYFINPILINNLNFSYSINIQKIQLQPLLEGSISNPKTVTNCPNMWYMFLNTKNSTNMSIDPTNQNVFTQNASVYFGLNNSVLCDTGLCKYFNSELSMIGTDFSTFINSYYFANSIYLGQNTINSQTYYILMILPEALFNGTPLNTTQNTISIYSTSSTIFYINFNSYSSSAFVPQGNSVSGQNPPTNSGTISNTYQLSKVVMNVSNTPII